MHQNIFSYSLSIFPYFWAIIIGIFIVVAFFDVRRTETGYRLSWFRISLITIGSIVLLGIGMSFFGLGGRFNTMMANGVPYYGQHMMMTKQAQWMQPESGFLAGSLATISNDELEIIDLNGQKWSILLNEKTLIRPVVNISQGEIIKIIGSKKDANTFQAIEIRPWMGQGMMNGSGAGQDSGMGNGGGRGMMRGN